MKKHITILFILLLSGASAFGQRSTFIKFNPFTLPNELDVYLTRDFNRSFMLEVGAGFIYTDYWDNILNQVEFGQLIPNINEHQYLNAKGFAARLGARFYIISPELNTRASGIYFEPILLFKKVWYPSKEKELDSKDYKEKSFKYVSGLQLLVGRQHQWHSFYLDKYVGLGIKAKTYRFDDYQLVDPGQGAHVKNKGARTTTWLPDLELGIKIAFDLSKH